MIRYAIYFAPDANTPLWQFGSACIGYDAWCNRDVPQPQNDAFAGLDLAALTEDPRRYGFHGTLKAPFELADGRSEDELLDFAAAFAADTAMFSLPALQIAALGSFVALVPAERSAALHHLADDAVRAFEPFRAPLGPSDLARRLAQPLSVRQKQQLAGFGYPHIFEDFRFHMTLSGTVAEGEREALLTGLRALYAPIDAPVAIDGVTIFRQSTRSSRFTALRRLPFRGH